MMSHQEIIQQRITRLLHNLLLDISLVEYANKTTSQGINGL